MAIDPRVDIGHVHLKVADIERSLGFYRDVLGFEVQQRWGDQAAFVSAGGYHHHIGLNTWESHRGPAPPAETTGLYHVAIRYPSRAALADALRRLADARIVNPQASARADAEGKFIMTFLGGAGLTNLIVDGDVPAEVRLGEGDQAQQLSPKQLKAGLFGLTVVRR